MATDKSNEKNSQDHSEAYYEKLAGQEEIYLEEVEERARAVLISEQPSLSELSVDVVSLEAKCCVTDVGSCSGTAGSGDEQLEQAAEELVTGDSDDPPLSDDAVTKILKAS
ncbi:MAG: hypothetical protein ACJ71W_22885 [Terriglobales bacterium]